MKSPEKAVKWATQNQCWLLKKNINAPRPSELPSVRGKTCREAMARLSRSNYIIPYERHDLPISAKQSIRHPDMSPHLSAHIS